MALHDHPPNLSILARQTHPGRGLKIAVVVNPAMCSSACNHLHFDHRRYRLTFISGFDPWTPADSCRPPKMARRGLTAPPPRDTFPVQVAPPAAAYSPDSRGKTHPRPPTSELPSPSASQEPFRRHGDQKFRRLPVRLAGRNRDLAVQHPASAPDFRCPPPVPPAPPSGKRAAPAARRCGRIRETDRATAP